MIPSSRLPQPLLNQVSHRWTSLLPGSHHPPYLLSRSTRFRASLLQLWVGLPAALPCWMVLHASSFISRSIARSSAQIAQTHGPRSRPRLVTPSRRPLGDIALEFSLFMPTSSWNPRMSISQRLA